MNVPLRPMQLVHIYMYIDVNMDMYEYTDIYMCMYGYIIICTCVYICIYIYTCIYVYIYMCNMRMYISARTYIYTYIYKYIRTYIYTYYTLTYVRKLADNQQSLPRVCVCVCIHTYIILNPTAVPPRIDPLQKNW